jgi:CubicO group peptidase (beta-lactamase class C family)
MRHALFLFCCLLALSPASALAGDADALMSRYAGKVPGASLLVLKDGKPVLRKAYGYADLEAGIAATPATNYRLASISKQFTATAILLLAEDGKLKLTDSVRHWLPSLPANDQGITIHHLLSHSSGLIDYEDLIPPGTTRQLDDGDVLRMLSAETRTYFAPGTGYRYSNSGYVLLGLIVERASGQRLPDFLRKRIFQPLHMDHTMLREPDGPQPTHRAYGYSEQDGRWVRTDQDLTSATRGDGGIYSSIDDLAKWDAALYDARLLKDASRRLAFAAQNKVTGEADVDSYGYGWRIHGDVLWHSGESIGFRNVIVRWPKQRVTVILLSNRNDPEPYGMALEVARPYLKP